MKYSKKQIVIMFSAVVLFSCVGLIAEEIMDSSSKQIRVYSAQRNEYVMVDPMTKSESDWRKELSAEQFSVTRQKGTEKPFTGVYYRNKETGLYRCIACGNDLFASEKKFDSGTGWPSYWDPVAPENVEMEEDRSLFMKRTEVKCSRCGAHLGHVFDDGPAPTGKRYCINSAALNFCPIKAPEPASGQ